ncbi:MAG TPA: alpha/beta fold hydrolase, partial [Acetobacteraceae bacterium]|nr:alpha/beta fold hydrolase [Acetobacteraceae bacterium]
ANWGAIQRALAPKHRVLAMDLRNHGASPQDPAMGYAAMAEDVAETMAAAGTFPAAIAGHSMGGKVAMMLALTRPEAVTHLLVSDMAPVRYPPGLRGYVTAMQALPLAPGLTRRAADAALAGAVPEPGIRAFLLQNLLFVRDPPAWRIGLDAIARAMPEIEGFEPPSGARYEGPVLFVAGARSDYIRPEHRPAIVALFPRARFVTIREASHWVHADQPRAFADTLGAFLG